MSAKIKQIKLTHPYKIEPNRPPIIKMDCIHEESALVKGPVVNVVSFDCKTIIPGDAHPIEAP